MGAALLEPGEIARIERPALTPDRKVPASAAGPHRSVIHGRSLDVVEWREYQPGDDPRTIDVQAWARLDQVLVRLYEGDVDLRIQLVVEPRRPWHRRQTSPRNKSRRRNRRRGVVAQ